MTLIIYEKGKQQIRNNSNNPLILEGKELELVDYTDTTGFQEFCRVRFKGDNKDYYGQHYKIHYKIEGGN